MTVGLKQEIYPVTDRLNFVGRDGEGCCGSAILPFSYDRPFALSHFFSTLFADDFADKK